MTDQDPRIVPDQTGVARLLIYAGIPIGAFGLAVFLTVILSWDRGTDLCPTWLHLMLPYCD